jgi:hypothetical protein
LAIELADNQIILAADAAVIGVLQQPHYEFAPQGVKLSRALIDFQENVLQHVFRFRVVAEDAQCHAADHALIAIEEDRQRVAVAGLDFVHERDIIERAQFGVVVGTLRTPLT